MASVTWTLVLHTSSTTTALKLLDRTLRRLNVPICDIDLRPWDADHGRRVAHLVTEVEAPDLLAACLRLGAALSETWTYDLSPAPEGVLFMAWTPAEYRRLTLDGLDAVSLVAHASRASLPAAPSARQYVLPGGQIVRVMTRD